MDGSNPCIGLQLWFGAAVTSGIDHVVKVNQRRARLVLELVIFGRIHPGHSGPLSLAIPPSSDRRLLLCTDLVLRVCKCYQITSKKFKDEWSLLGTSGIFRVGAVGRLPPCWLRFY